MSTWCTREVTCPCGASFRAQVADGLHITRLPGVRRQILEGTFHRVRCPGCAEVREVQREFLYSDFDRLHWIRVCPPARTAEWSDLEAEVRDRFERTMVHAAPPMVRSWAPRFTTRLVFGYDQLAEKLHTFDAGLDDRDLELLKLEALRRHPELIVPGVQVLLRPPVAGDPRLVFEVRGRGDATCTPLVCSRAALEEVAARRAAYAEAWPGLAGATFVHLDRVLYPALTEPGAREAAASWRHLIEARWPPIPPPRRPGVEE